MQKHHFKGMFMFQRELYILYSYAYTKEQAFLLMCRRIAKKQGVNVRMVINYFKGKENSHDIKELIGG
jgi:hypothetical protein